MSEFSRPVRIDTIGGEARQFALEASAEERAALARRFEIEALDALVAGASLVLRGGDIVATGSLEARLVQLCVATSAALPTALSVPFEIVFRSEPPGQAPDAGLELSEDECDVIFYEGGEIDLGEAVAQTLALSVDPYPRAPDADAVVKELGLLGEAEAGPFAVLSGLKA